MRRKRTFAGARWNRRTVELCASGRARHDRRIGPPRCPLGGRGRSFKWQTEIIWLEGSASRSAPCLTGGASLTLR
jgi:hypothetical protein